MTSEALADLLETLVNIPSETGHEAAIADWVAARLQAVRGGECHRSGNSVVWRLAAGDGAAENPPSAGAPPLLVLAGHLDTVPAQGNQAARRLDGKLYGLGSSDMK